jgi:hypothetical protein
MPTSPATPQHLPCNNATTGRNVALAELSPSKRSSFGPTTVIDDLIAVHLEQRALGVALLEAPMIAIENGLN